MPQDDTPEKKDPTCYVAEIQIRNLWGYRDLTLPFNREANILIGRNATGKTSVINLLRFLLTLDISALLEITFEHVSVALHAYDDSSRHRLSAKITDGQLAIELDDSVYVSVDLPPNFRTAYALGEIEYSDAKRLLNPRRSGESRLHELQAKLSAMVPSVWLPVNRSAAVEREEQAHMWYRSGESEKKDGPVEERLELLLSELKTYRLALEARLSAKYKEFERQVLSLILFNKSYDNLQSFRWESASTDEERERLTTAFREAGLLDWEMQTRIKEHFKAQAEAIERVQKRLNPKGHPIGIDVDDIFIVPLVRRTKEMIRYARAIETNKQEIFSALTKYSEIASDFLHDKKVSVSDKGTLILDYLNFKAQGLTHRHLSSGEKQILILLTQALIFEGKPVIYVADEPELSLHVSWQEKLLSALRALNPQMQLIIATHSPDIVGRRPTLDLERYYR